MCALHALCALSARNARQMPSSSVNVRNPARRKAAESLAFALGLASPKAEVTGSNPVGSAIFSRNFSPRRRSEKGADNKRRAGRNRRAGRWIERHWGSSGIGDRAGLELEDRRLQG